MIKHIIYVNNHNYIKHHKINYYNNNLNKINNQ